MEWGSENSSLLMTGRVHTAPIYWAKGCFKRHALSHSRWLYLVSLQRTHSRNQSINHKGLLSRQTVFAEFVLRTDQHGHTKHVNVQWHRVHFCYVCRPWMWRYECLAGLGHGAVVITPWPGWQRSMVLAAFQATLKAQCWFLRQLC